MNNFGDVAQTLDLGIMPDFIRDKFEENEIELKKEFSQILSESRKLAKEEKCIYCGEKVNSFCNSHSVPAFILKNIAVNGEVYNSNELVKIPLIEGESGVNSSGTFRIICRDCDSKIFSDYENPDNYCNKPTSKMIAQIAMKNFLKCISKRKLEIQFYDLLFTEYGLPEDIYRQKQMINNIDLEEYMKDYERAKRVDLKGWDNEYYMFYYEKLNYVVPIAFQSNIALTTDLEGSVINDIYHMSKDYKIQSLHICIFPFENSSTIFLFIDSKERRYRQFYKQFNKLSFEDKLVVVNYIIFSYSEDVFMSKEINDLVIQNEYLIKSSRKSSDIISTTKDFDTDTLLKETFDFSEMHLIPNLLSEEYKIR